jgi:hypothetical protein
MSTLDEHILRILAEATEGLFSSELTERLNKEVRPDSAYTSAQIAHHLKVMSEKFVQLLDGRWMLEKIRRLTRVLCANHC